MFAVSPDSSVRTTVEGRELTISNLDKVFYPVSGFTKGEMLDYYARIAPIMLKHIRDRPLTVKRFPHGVDGPSFFEKHPPARAPAWLRRVAVPSSSNGDPTEYMVVSDLPSLIWAANLASIEFHVPLWHAGRRRTLPGPPDHMVFDLDPGEGSSIVGCCKVGGYIADILKRQNLECRPKTSGSKGLQLYVPLGGRPTWQRVREDAHQIAIQLEHDHPDLVVSTMRRSLRRGKILIDWSQNHPAKTTVAAYSLRARPDPTVSTPVTWQEVAECEDQEDPDLLRFTSSDVLERVDILGDLFDDV
jgi:bifunctional non-homologous end joining protein LigD